MGMLAEFADLAATCMHSHKIAKRRVSLCGCARGQKTKYLCVVPCVLMRGCMCVCVCLHVEMTAFNHPHF